MDTNLEIIFGVFLIVIYAFDRFNTPSNVRASTTAGRYMTSVFLYLMIYLVTFNIFMKYPKLLEFMNIDFGLADGAAINPGDSTTILIALVLSLLVPKVPLISQVDDRLRKFLHGLAAIPYEAIRLSQEMQDAELVIPEPMHNAVYNEMDAQAIDENIINLHTNDPVIKDGLNDIYLMIRLRKWGKENRFISFMQERASQMHRLTEHYKRFLSMLKNLSSLIEQAEANPDVAALKDAENNFRKSLHLERAALHREICDFISHAILSCCLTDGNRKKILKEIGFVCDSNKRSRMNRTINQSIMLFSLLLLFVLVNFILFDIPAANVEETLLKVTMIVTIYSTAVIFALFPKQVWSLFKYKDDNYPVSGYVLSGFMSLLASLGIGLFFKTIIFSNNDELTGWSAPFNQAWMDMTTYSYPWLSMAFITAVSIAFLSDWTVLKARPVYMRRLLDGVVQGLVLTATAGLVHWWLTGLGMPERLPPFPQLLVIAFGIGFVLGFIVPSWYRKSWVEEQDHREYVQQLEATTHMKVVGL